MEIQKVTLPTNMSVFSEFGLSNSSCERVCFSGRDRSSRYCLKHSWEMSFIFAAKVRKLVLEAPRKLSEAQTNNVSSHAFPGLLSNDHMPGHSTKPSSEIQKK